MFYPEHYNSRSQDLEDAYHDAGQFYWELPMPVEERIIISENASPTLIPRNRVQILYT